VIINVTHAKAMHLTVSNALQAGSRHLYVNATLAITINLFQTTKSVMPIFATRNVKLVSMLHLPVWLVLLEEWIHQNVHATWGTMNKRIPAINSVCSVLHMNSTIPPRNLALRAIQPAKNVRHPAIPARNARMISSFTIKNAFALI